MNNCPDCGALLEKCRLYEMDTHIYYCTRCVSEFDENGALQEVLK
jgi:DNA-directed RNA polymerase subunit RPC12/RpoP